MTLVLLRLAEDDGFEDDEIEPYHEPEVDLQDSYRERPNVRKLSSRRRRTDRRQFFADDRAASARLPAGARWAVPAPHGPPRGRDVRVHSVRPRT